MIDSSAGELTDQSVICTFDLQGVDWEDLVRFLEEDDFHNGRSPGQLERSFRNSAVTVLAFEGKCCVGTARVLSDGVCNAYVVDVWTHSRLRRRGIGRRMMGMVLAKLPGQHVYVFTNSSPEFYEALGFEAQGTGYGCVMGRWLDSGASREGRSTPPSD